MFKYLFMVAMGALVLVGAYAGYLMYQSKQDALLIERQGDTINGYIFSLAACEAKAKNVSEDKKSDDEIDNIPDSDLHNVPDHWLRQTKPGVGGI